jgi:hypothetical protein
LSSLNTLFSLSSVTSCKLIFDLLDLSDFLLFSPGDLPSFNPGDTPSFSPGDLPLFSPGDLPPLSPGDLPSLILVGILNVLTLGF